MRFGRLGGDDRLSIVIFWTAGASAQPSRSPYPEEDDAMLENDVNGLTELDEDILTFDVPDDALERASGFAEERAMTWVYGTGVAGNCGCPVIE